MKKKSTPKKTKLPTPWRRVERILNPSFEVSVSGSFYANSAHIETKEYIDLRSSYTIKYCRRNERGYKEWKEVKERGPSLSDLIRHVHLSHKEEAILDMFLNGLSLFGRLAQRYDWRMKRLAERALQQRRKEYAKKRAMWAEARLVKDLSSRRKNHQRARRLFLD